jgi:hypothetical protein
MEVVLGPLGNLIWNQRDTPLHIRCDRFLNELLSPAGQGVAVAVAAPALKLGEEKEPFAPMSYSNIPANMALHASPFEHLTSGIRIGGKEGIGSSVDQPPAAQVLLLPAPAILPDPLPKWDIDLSGHAWFRAVADIGLAAPKVWDQKSRVSTADDVWITADGQAHNTLTTAWQHSRHASGGVPVHKLDPMIDTGVI